ncbi:hypothetical protein C8R47DRAFT_1230037 [Mycena vitilis]|nr:hypothetical protein C8R47DRAFT_1230037 [Mycena vitilis]
MKCPELADVEIEGRVYGPELREQLPGNISLFLRGLKHIQRLHIRVEHLATISTFNSLHLESSSEGILCRSVPPGGGSRFTHLTSLTLTLPADFASHILLCHPPLEEIDITISPVAGIEVLSDLYRTMGDNLPPTAMRSLTFVNKHYSQLVGAAALIALPPQLLGFHNLTKLELVNDYVFAFSDALVLEMALAWPKLQRLHLLSSDPGTDFDPTVTLASLCVFAQHCPALKMLAIDISARIIPPLDGFHCAFRPALETLLVGYAPIDDPSAVAEFILAVFPKVAGVRAEQSQSLSTVEHRELSGRWQAVRKILARKRRIA